MTGGGSGGMRGGCADGHVDVPGGFPPYPLYDLVPGPGVAARLVADGPRPVYYTRRERKGPRFGTGSTVHDFRVDDVTREWLAAMAGVKGKSLGLPTSRSLDLIWETGEKYAAEAAKYRDEYVEKHWNLIRRLVARKALTLEEARKCVPHVSVRVTDKRKDPNVPLPAIPETTVKPGLPEEIR